MTEAIDDLPAPAPTGERGRLARAGLAIAAGGVAARALGWVRLIVIAAIFGASRELDAYFAAFRVPDAIFQLVAGGALGSVLIPLVAGAADERAAWRVVSGVANVLLVALAVLALAGAVAAPWVVPFIAPGFDDAQLSLTVDLTRVMLVSPVCFALGAVAMSVLQSRGRFAPTAFAPLVYNGAIIAAAVGLSGQLGVMALAIGVALGAAGYLVVQLVPLFVSTPFRYARDAGWREPGVGRAVALLVPRSVGLAGTQLIFIVNTALASTLATGAVTAYTVAFTLLLIPVGLVGAPLGIVVFPSLARVAARGSAADFGRVLVSALRFALWSAALLTALGMALHVPLVELLFGHGRLAQSTGAIAGTAVVLFAGIGAHSINLVAARAFYARHDTRTPALLTLAQVALTLAIGIPGAAIAGLPGLALAVAVGSWAKSIAMLVILNRRAVLDGRSLLAAGVRFGIAGVAAAAAAFVVADLVGSLAAGFSDTARSAAMLVAGTTAGAAAYALAAVALRVPELRRTVHLARLALGRRATGSVR